MLILTALLLLWHCKLFLASRSINTDNRARGGAAGGGGGGGRSLS